MSGSFVSAARGGIPTNYIIARPPGQIAPLRPVIALHGVRGSAKQVMSFGVEQVLADLVTAGRPPFAVVAVDGGDSYWHRRAGGEDAGSMVLNELIPMLSTMSMDITRVGFIGWSMGGYGAMLLGAPTGSGAHRRDLRGQPRAVPVLHRQHVRAHSTATTTGRTTPSSDRLRCRRFRCGSTAATTTSSRRPRISSSAQLRTPPAGGFAPGGHDEAYWRQQLPGELAWLAS